MWKKLLSSFFLGGLIIALVIFFNEKIHPSAAAILYSYPAIYVLSVAFLYDKPKVAKEYSFEAIPAAMGIGLYLLLVPLVFHFITDNVFLAIFISTIIWIPFTILTFYIHWNL